MTTLQRTRWQIGMAVFVLATPPILWILMRLIGRSLSAFELVGIAGSIAAVVATFTWAFGTQTETGPHDVDVLDVNVVFNLSAAPAIDEKAKSRLGSEGMLVELKSVTNLSDSPRPFAISTLRLAESPNDGSGGIGGPANTGTNATSGQLARPLQVSTILRGTDKSRINSIETEGSRYLAEVIDRNERLRHKDGPHPINEHRWFGAGETLAVADYLLKDPMVYVSEGKSRDDEASCIDLRLFVGQSHLGTRNESSQLHLSYATPRSKPTHKIPRLAVSRSGTASWTDIGFAFLFFYGLERRLLVEQQDQGPILKEVVRLLDTYNVSGAFNECLNQFLAFSLARFDVQSTDDQLFRAIFEKRRVKWDESLMAVAFAWLYKRHVPLPASWAFRVARKDPNFPKNSCFTPIAPSDELKSLFKKRYQERFGSGLILEASRDDHEIQYSPSNPSLPIDASSSGSSNTRIRIPTVLGFKSQFHPLANILSRCVDELRLSNRVLTEQNLVPVSPEPGSPPPPTMTTNPVAHTAQSIPGDSEGVKVRVEVKDRDQIIRQEKNSASSRELRWFGRGEIITLSKYQLKDPMVYISEVRPREDEASCIDLSLDTGHSVMGPGAPMPVSPSYANFDPDQRANYLRWLANGRVDRLDNIGYAFVFFFGLERRLLHERKDLPVILEEVVGLMRHYDDDYLFFAYLDLFLAFSLARHGINEIDDRLFGSVLEKAMFRRDGSPAKLKGEDHALAVALAWFYNKGVPLPASWGFRIACRDLHFLDSALLHFPPERLTSLFESRYLERFGFGLTLDADDEFELRYRPANPSLRSRVDELRSSSRPITIPNVLGLKGQFQPLVTILSGCVDDLRPSSRAPVSETKVQGPPKPSTRSALNLTISPTAPPSKSDPRPFEQDGFRVKVTDRYQAGHHLEPSSPSRELRWYGKGDTVTLSTYELKDPMVYVSDGRPLEDEASCIDLSLPVGKCAMGSALAMALYPTYAQFTPDQRANYLDWLASDRVRGLDNIGYAFLFFFGLERHLVIERKDLPLILEEVVRLMKHYPSSVLLSTSLDLFLVFSLARHGIDAIDHHLFGSVLEMAAVTRDASPSKLTFEENLLALALAWFYKKRVPLPGSWGFRIACRDPYYLDNSLLDLQRERLRSLFKIRYEERFGHGLILKANDHDFELRYRPANPSIRGKFDELRPSSGPTKIPDVLGFKSQFYPLASILSGCVDDLRPSSRVSFKESQNYNRPVPYTLPAASLATTPVAPTPRADSLPSERVGVQFETLIRNDAVLHKEPARRAREVRWAGNGETVNVGGYQLKDPLIYVSDGHPRESEASCIDLSLDVGKPVREAAGSLGYYPTYEKLSPDRRANYLRWLSTGRVEPLADIGYAFLFFYGLERRLLVEQQDLFPSVKEAVRLLETYTFSSSFDGYLSRFLAFTLAKSGIETLKDKWFDAVFAKSRLQRDEDFIAVALAWFFKKNAPLPVSWAIRIARQDPRCPRSVVLDRLPEQFQALFESRYRGQFGDGLVLKVSKRDRPLNYRPASPSLLNVALSSGSTEPIKIPNVLGIQSQFSPLVEIWSSCIEELRPLSRVLAGGTEGDSREAFEALPDELKVKVDHPDKEKWDRVVTEHVDKGGWALVEVTKLAAIHGLVERTKLTPKQSKALAQSAEHVGLMIEPDARLTDRPYSWEDLVCLLRPDERPELPADSRYLAVSMMLELGVYVAAADGTVEEVEIDQVARFLESQVLLDPPDARRLEALKRVFLARPPSLTGLGKRLQRGLTREQREAVGRFLTGIAAANGIIDRKEVTALRSAYRALDIGVEQLNRLLEEFRLASQEPVEVQRGDSSSDLGETIPARAKSKDALGFTFNDGLRKRLLAETQAVAVMLGEAMRDENIAEEEEYQPTVLVASLNHLTGLREGEAFFRTGLPKSRPAEGRP